MMARGRIPTESRNKNYNGARSRGNVDGKVAQIPVSHNSGNEAEKLSEAAGGISDKEAPDESALFPPDIEKGDDESKNSQESDNGLVHQGKVVNIKASKVRRLSPTMYRSLSLNAEQGFKSPPKDYGNFESGSDVTKSDFININIPWQYKKSTSATWTQTEVVSTSDSLIQLGSTDSCEVQPVGGYLEQKNDRLKSLYRILAIDDQSLAPCTDIGGVGSAVSGSTEIKPHSNYPLLHVASNSKYKHGYNNLKKRAKSSHKQRMSSHFESACSSSGHCFHPNQTHDWRSHDAKKMYMYNYAASRTGHIWARERHTNFFTEVGTCSHIGDGYVLTCFHCIEKIFLRDDWQNEQYLQQDLVVTFPEIGVQKLHPGSTLVKYGFEPCLFSHSETKELDYAVLRLDLGDAEQVPPHYAKYTNKTIDQELPVYIAGYQLHPKYPYGKLVMDSTALKLPRQALSLDSVKSWSKKLGSSFQAQARKSTHYPVNRCGRFSPLLTKLIMGASGGFGLTSHPQDDLPVVNFMYRAGYPKAYYASFFDNASTSCDDRLAIQNNLPPCWTFQEGTPIGTIVEEIKKSPFPSLNSISFLQSDI
ncbi:uncharacterized protein LOC117342160 [Pecten maximus]|uniref:uncharacterized protein LOC117342160 n=1 Tax=Pecten maximus TaxID=6579 RepID=UPI0014581B3C|nr:uncharacterized protein LOC117342160 [Pecten maximus]